MSAASTGAASTGRIDVMRPWLGTEESDALAEVIASGWIAQGPRVARFEAAFAEAMGVGHAVAIPGISLVQDANSSNYSNMFVILKPFEERRGAEHSADAILARLRDRLGREVADGGEVHGAQRDGFAAAAA